MVQAVINLNEREARILNIVKGKFGLKNKSEAISLIVNEYEQELLEPELRPGYIEKLNILEKQKGIPFKNITGLRKIIEG